MTREQIRETNLKLNSKLSKEELFELEEKIRGYFDSGNASVELRSLNKRVKRALYECRDCADAKFRYIKAKQDEMFVDDCGKDVCPYADYFKDQDKLIELEEKIKKLLI